MLYKVFLMAQQPHLGIKVFVATNQSGIGRGYFSEDDYRVVEHYIERLLKRMVVQLPKHIIARVILSMGLVSIK